MRIEKILKEANKDYLKIEPPKDLVKYGWWALRKEIEKAERPKFAFLPIFTRTITFAIVALIILGGASFTLVYASQKALPGDTLYPIKRFSEDITSAISGNNQIKVEKRAEDVVGAADKKDEEVIKEAVKEYKEAVSDTKKKIKPKNKEDFDEKLKRQEKLFEQVLKESPELEDLKDAIEASRKSRDGEIKEPKLPQDVLR